MQKFFSIAGLVGIGIIGRLLPHLPNATPIAAVTLMARRHLGALWAFILPLLTMLVSDAIIGFYDWKILLSVYLSFCLTAILSLILRADSSPVAVVFVALVSSVVFFGITNFAVWLFSPWYVKSMDGLIYCYTLGLPFLRNMMLGDIIYTLGLMTAYEASGAIPGRRELEKAHHPAFQATKWNEKRFLRIAQRLGLTRASFPCLSFGFNLARPRGFQKLKTDAPAFESESGPVIAQNKSRNARLRFAIAGRLGLEPR